ncbi:hypothetical protein Bxe_B2394 [Paraburkholderia xenovorans LB400]|uniref:Uncharacterized protein n=1 Tax=Paraburkholderia xenovorans (strain LB400) TaxID=266265 RepID=Q13QP4_PARXL|nr:hypothetical protein Bxe_B2394 [Paraburkholderia xenovorans LB400]
MMRLRCLLARLGGLCRGSDSRYNRPRRSRTGRPASWLRAMRGRHRNAVGQTRSREVIAAGQARKGEDSDSFASRRASFRCSSVQMNDGASQRIAGPAKYPEAALKRC